MALQKIAGTRGKYIADTRGLVDVGRFAAVGEAALDAARRGAALGRQYDPQGTYEAEARTVRGGWSHDLRAGSAVVQVKPGSRKAVERMVMSDVLIGMESRRGQP